MADTEHKVLAEETADEAAAGVTVKPATTAPYQYDPSGRFSGNGVLFKAKLFGTADVNEPRGDSVCNTAIAMLKTAVKTTGEHKQRIFFRVNLSGITIVDAVNQTTLYEHQVNKISFISKDPNDNRAFGYIVTEKDGKHTYFGIKTEKAADQVIMSLRDMFQAVFDHKKKKAETQTSVTEAKAPAPAAATTTATAAATPAAAEPPTTPTTEPILGDVTDSTAQPKKVERENSSSHLLELLGDLNVSAPAPQAVAPAANQPFGQQPWPPQNAAASSWGNAVAAQNDPFMVHPQPTLFGQQPTQQIPAQTMAFPPQQQPNGYQASAQSPFSQQFSQPQTQPMFQNPQQQVFSPQNVQPMFGVSQQQPMFQQPMGQQPMGQQQMGQQPMGQQPMGQQQMGQQPMGQQPMVRQPMAQQQPTMASPFAQPPQAAAPQPFVNDPFSTNAFSSAAPQMQPAALPQAGNPFASTGSESFGVLQPQQVPQPAPRSSVGQTHQPSNLFSDLNPLPSTDQPLGKDQFFNDVKNPPKPKLNEMPTTQQTEPAINSTAQFQPMANFTNTPQNYDWIDQLLGTSQNQMPATGAINAPVQQVPVGLIAPPPSHSRQRQGQPPLVRPM